MNPIKRPLLNTETAAASIWAISTSMRSPSWVIPVKTSPEESICENLWETFPSSRIASVRYDFSLNGISLS